MATSGLNAVRSRMVSAAAEAGRDVTDIDLVVVSKLRSDAEVLAVYAEGQRTFAENRQQAFKARIDADLPDDIEWHFVGPLQSRKARYVAQHASLLHSLDRLSLAQRWVAAEGGPALIQFNLAGEPQKSGFDPDRAHEVLDTVLETGADVRGVMAIPPITRDPRDSAPWFRMLRGIYDDFRERNGNIVVCSMGMTNDLEIAILEGATTIRVGRAIFEGTNSHTG
ncbi:MAG: YggS family pyridoxal phosphate-dependent enzyme [Actinomycetota bacterium]